MLYVYDMSLWIGCGHQLRLHPGMVCLHTGAAAGAAEMGLPGERLPLSAFPPYWRKQGDNFIESMFCHFYSKDSLHSILSSPNDDLLS